MGRSVFDMDYVFGHLVQPEATVCVLHMIDEVIVGRDKLNGHVTVKSWFKNVCISCQ